MSADNGIYIAEFSNGYRVIHAQAIDNIFYYRKNTKVRKKVIKNYFKDAKLFKTKSKAKKEAFKLYEEIINDDFCPICEYGIQYLGKLEDFEE